MNIRKQVLGIFGAMLALCTAVASAADRPYAEGAVLDVSSIRTEPGMFDSYMEFLATTYKQNMEEQKAAGIILDYSVHMAVPRGPDDPDIYLLTVYKNMAALDGLVCNALDCILVHNQIAQSYLPAIAKEWAKAGVEMHCDKRAMSILKTKDVIPSEVQNLLIPATDDDWGKEYLSLKAAIKVVDSLDEALEHIENNGSGHSEAIVAEDQSVATRFLNEVDAACVYANVMAPASPMGDSLAWAPR